MTMSVASYDVEAVRRDFPILAEKVYGKPLVYLDNGASAQKPMAVLNRIQHAYTHEYANVHRGLHYLSNAATEAYEDAREAVRAFLNAPSIEQVIFTRSSTEAINLVAASYGGMVLGEGDEVILSILEHHSNIVPWNFHREKKGVVIKWAPVHDDGAFDLEAFEKLFTPRTKIVAITQMSNVTGTIVPIREVTRIAHAHGAVVLVDGSQGAVHLPVDVQDLDADFYALTGHKVYGPTGIGVLYGKRKLLDAMPPFLGGGDMIETVTLERTTYAAAPARFEAGTPPIIEAVGLHAAIDYVTSIGMPAIEAHERALVDHAMAVLPQVAGLQIIGEAQDRGGVFSFALDGVHPHDLSTFLDRHGIAVRAGRHCAEPLHARFGVEGGTTRASFGLYTTPEEIDLLAQKLTEARRFFA